MDDDLPTQALPEHLPLRCVLMRGGTSKGVFLRAADLPSDPRQRDRVILALFGSPDPRQIDGLGGADILTSKVAIIGPPSRPDADVDYTFGQVSITEPVVDYDMNCGNISAAVGVYAIEEGLVRPTDPLTHVRVHNTNTRTVFTVSVPTLHGMPQVEGECRIDGVPGTGAEILLDYAGTAGAATGALLPTGRVRDSLTVPALRRSLEVSLVDLANLCLFVRAQDLGLAGTEGPGDLPASALDSIAAVKEAAAAVVGVRPDGLIPIPVLVAPPATYTTFLGTTVDAASVDLVARVVGGRPLVLHKAYPGTAAACTATAAAIPGTIPADVARPRAPGRWVIGHPSGTMTVASEVAEAGGTYRVARAAYARTARRLLDGVAYVRVRALEPDRVSARLLGARGGDTVNA
jgi:2-methylaconitate cis-trans-isomerase PrpF